MTKFEIAKKVIIDAGGIAKTSMFVEKGLCRFDISKLASDGLIKRICHGFYSLVDGSDLSEAEYIAKLIPEGIVCMESALFHYGYSDFTPRQWSIAVPRMVSQNKIKSKWLSGWRLVLLLLVATAAIFCFIYYRVWEYILGFFGVIMLLAYADDLFKRKK